MIDETIQILYLLINHRQISSHFIMTPITSLIYINMYGVALNNAQIVKFCIVTHFKFKYKDANLLKTLRSIQ